MTTELAQINVGRLKYDPDDPRLADFLQGREVLDRILARTPGFLWKHARSFSPAPMSDEDTRMLTSLSVWESRAALDHFVWTTLHKRFWARRAEWFEPSPEPSMALWYVPAGHRPTLAEAMEKLDHLRVHGESARAFGWDWPAQSST